MADTRDDFAVLMENVSAGSEEAIRTLLDQYGSYIFRAIRRRLNRRMRTQYDSQDFAQAVWASFFANREAIPRFARPEELVAFLGTVAGNKVIDEIRRCFDTQKRNLNRDQSLESTITRSGISPVSKSPSPSQVAVAKDQLEILTKDEPSEYRRVVELRMSGATFNEIADELGINEKTARRLLGRMSRRWNDTERRNDDDQS